MQDIDAPLECEIFSCFLCIFRENDLISLKLLYDLSKIPVFQRGHDP
jgi:hypothetical protein